MHFISFFCKHKITFKEYMFFLDLGRRLVKHFLKVPYGENPSLLCLVCFKNLYMLYVSASVQHKQSLHLLASLPQSVLT